MHFALFLFIFLFIYVNLDKCITFIRNYFITFVFVI